MNRRIDYEYDYEHEHERALEERARGLGTGLRTAFRLKAVFYIGILAAALAFAEPRIGVLNPLADSYFMCGNGGLTAAVDRDSGRVSMCRWPGPGSANQVRQSFAADSRQDGNTLPGLAWGIGLPGGVTWLGEPRQHVTPKGMACRVEVDFATDEPAIKATQLVFVCPESDVLVARLTLHNTAAERIYWAGGFGPCTRAVPEWPSLADAPGSLNGFATYTADRGKTVIHFRPGNPGRSEWAKAEELAAAMCSGQAGNAAAGWQSFGEGVWIACAATNEVLGFQCGPNDSAPAAVGSCGSMLTLRPDKKDGEATATIMAAFGKDYATATANLKTALDRGYDALALDLHEYWMERIDAAPMPHVDDAAVIGECKRDLAVLLQCTDRNTGAIVRAPSGRNPWAALDWVRDGAWATLALDMAGYRDLAERHTLFYASAFRKESKPGKPYGSMPAALTSEGVEGAPHVVLDVDAAAWTLASFYRHASFLELPVQLDFLSKIKPQATSAADFIAGWTDARTRLPLYSFDYELWRDAPSNSRLLTTYMGIDAALRMSELQSAHAPDEWTHRKRDLEALIRFECVDQAGQWKDEATLPFWQAELAPSELPTWESAIERRLNDPDHPGNAGVSEVCDAALLWQDQPGKLARLRAPLGALPPIGSDALAAAQHFIAASLIYAPPRER